MKTLYIDCAMGAAGDMLMSALSELIPDADMFIKQMNGIGLDGVTFIRKKVSVGSVHGSHIAVIVDGQEEGVHPIEMQKKAHQSVSMKEIENIICGLSVSDKVKRDIYSVYQMLADAESYVHGVPVAEIHFHRLGRMDAVADITGVCLLMEMLSPEKVIASPIHVGMGQIKCRNGKVLLIPAPATAYLLEGMQFYSGTVEGELCTPTGAALLKYFADGFETMPNMDSGKIGYGFGTYIINDTDYIRVIIS